MANSQHISGSTPMTELHSRINKVASISADSSNSIKLTLSKKEAENLKFSVKLGNTDYDMSLSDNLSSRALAGVAKIQRIRNQDGTIDVRIDIDKSYRQNCKLSIDGKTSDIGNSILDSLPSRGKVNEVKSRDHTSITPSQLESLVLPRLETTASPNSVPATRPNYKLQSQADSLESPIRSLVPDITSKPISKTETPELFDLYEQRKKEGFEFVVVPGSSEKFGYALLKNNVIVSQAEIPAGGEGFYEKRSQILAAMLENPTQNPYGNSLRIQQVMGDRGYVKSQPTYTKLAPELNSEISRLRKLGLGLNIKEENSNLHIMIKDEKSGRSGEVLAVLSKDEFKNLVRGEGASSSTVLETLKTINNRSDILINNISTASKEFNEKIKDLTNKIPEKLLDQLISQGYKISPRRNTMDGDALLTTGTPRGYTNGETYNSAPGLLRGDKKEIIISEYFISSKGQTVKSNPENYLYHEVGHAWQRIMEKSNSNWDEILGNLEVAYTRDKNAINTIASYSRGEVSVDGRTTHAAAIKNNLNYLLQEKNGLDEAVAEVVETYLTKKSDNANVIERYFSNLSRAVGSELSRQGVIEK